MLLQYFNMLFFIYFGKFGKTSELAWRSQAFKLLLPPPFFFKLLRLEQCPFFLTQWPWTGFTGDETLSVASASICTFWLLIGGQCEHFAPRTRIPLGHRAHLLPEWWMMAGWLFQHFVTGFLFQRTNVTPSETSESFTQGWTRLCEAFSCVPFLFALSIVVSMITSHFVDKLGKNYKNLCYDIVIIWVSGQRHK